MIRLRAVFLFLICVLVDINRGEIDLEGFRPTFNFEPYEQDWVMNNSALTIASSTYNPSSHTSKWISRLFGDEAIFHNRTYSGRAGAPLTPQEKRDRSKLFAEHFRLPPEALLPSCSFEFLTYALVDYDHPLSHYYMYTAPSVGLASLTFDALPRSKDFAHAEKWACYYRGMYEFTVKRLMVLPLTHWPVFVYCPAPRYDHSCLNLLSRYQERLKTASLASPVSYTPQGTRQLNPRRAVLPVRLKLEMVHSSFETAFNLDINNIARRSFQQHSAPPLYTPYQPLAPAVEAQRRKKDTRAVCVVIPYTAKLGERQSVNNAMAFDFVRYYNRLGFHVAIYDRGGINRDRIFQSDYAKAQRKANGDKDDSFRFSYFNYTALERLLPQLKYFSADGVDSGMLSKVVVRADVDKRLTYTHCRAQLQHLYGIEDVFIADFDEFLYCPRAPATATGQKQYLDRYLAHLKGRGVEQLVVKQRVLVPRTADLHDNNMTKCLLQQVRDAHTYLQHGDSNASGILANPNPSLFHCLSRFEYGIKMFFDKSLHMSSACPFTSFHFASHLRLYDCYANSYLSASRSRKNYTVGGCSIVHLTTRPMHYNRSHPFDVAQAQKRPSEVFHILTDTSAATYDSANLDRGDDSARDVGVAATDTEAEAEAEEVADKAERQAVTEGP